MEPANRERQARFLRVAVGSFHSIKLSLDVIHSYSGLAALVSLGRLVSARVRPLPLSVMVLIP